MRDPDLAGRAQQAATELEQASEHWRTMHGPGGEPLPAVSSDVGYSLEEPWGEPGVVLGIEAGQAQRLATLLDRHDDTGPVPDRHPQILPGNGRRAGRTSGRTTPPARRSRSFKAPRVTSVARLRPRRRERIIWNVGVFLVLIGVTVGSADTERGRIILTAVQRFLLFYSGVFALIALTAAVGAGLVAADRIIMRPAGRIVAQGVHRAVSLAALAFLVVHIVTETLARRSRVVDAFVPFLAHGRTFYIGLGTIASDLVVILIVTGIARGRFVGRSPWAWRVIHATAYLCWLLALVHGLRAGRTALPYVDWSYGACVAAVGLALVVRLAGTVRDRRETAAHPVPDRAAGPVAAAIPLMTDARHTGAHALREHALRRRRLRRGALPGGVLRGPARGFAGEVPALPPLPGGERS